MWRNLKDSHLEHQFINQNKVYNSYSKGLNLFSNFTTRHANQMSFQLYKKLILKIEAPQSWLHRLILIQKYQSSLEIMKTKFNILTWTEAINGIF